MKKSVLICMVFSLLAAPPFLFARGGGGLEYSTNLGADVLGQLPLPSGDYLNFPTWSVTSLSGFGYGISPGGWKIGGFGTGFFTREMSLSVPGLDGAITGAAGGIGGMISGGHARIGPFAFALNMRLGIGGIGFTQTLPGTGTSFTDGVVTFYGSLDAEFGLVFTPAMLVSVYGGVAVLVPVPGLMGNPLLPVPTAGIRLAWGRF